MKTKLCAICGQPFKVRGRDMTCSKEHSVEYKRVARQAYVDANKERIDAINAKSRANNRKANMLRQRDYVERNREEVNRRNLERYHRNPESALAYMAERREEDIEASRARERECHLRNLDARRLKDMRKSGTNKGVLITFRWRYGRKPGDWKDVNAIKQILKQDGEL